MSFNYRNPMNATNQIKANIVKLHKKRDRILMFTQNVWTNWESVFYAKKNRNYRNQNTVITKPFNK